MMGAAVERDVLAELSTAMAAYLTAMSVTAECMEKAWPEVGAPYRKRLQGLQSRLSFEVTRAAIKDSSETLQSELKDFAEVVNRLQSERSVDLERGIVALRELIEILSHKQETFRKQLQELAADSPLDNMSAALTSLAENISREVAPTLAKMDSEVVSLGQRIAGPAAIDPVTGLINEVEFERQVAAYQMNGTAFSILLFRLGGPLGDQVMQQAAARLSAEFRRRDRVGRWGKNEFAVLFAGSPQKAEERAVHAAARLEGPYSLVNGEVVQITAAINILPSAAEL